MKWPSWVDDYPGLEEKLDKLAILLKACGNNPGFWPQDHSFHKRQSDIAQEAADLKAELNDVIMRCVKLNVSSISRGIIPDCSLLLTNNDSSLATDRNAVAWLLNVERRIKENLDCIESKHRDKSGAPKKEVDKYATEQMVIDATDSGLEIKNNNPHKYWELLKALYRNAGRDLPKKSMLITARREVKKKRKKT